MFLKNSKPLWKHVFPTMISFVFTNNLHKLKRKSQSTWLHKHLIDECYK